jgi:hypothetical protein
VFFVAILLPMVQQITGIIPEPRLAEKRRLVPPPVPTFSSVASGEFQTRFDRYMNDNYGLRSWIVLVNNQIDIGIFRVTR